MNTILNNCQINFVFKKTLLVNFMILFILSCNTRSEENQAKLLDEYKISKIKDIDFLLGDTVTNVILSFQYLDKETYKLSNDEIAAHDLPNNTISFFNISSKKLVKVIKPFTEGPNSIGEVMNGFHIKNMDSIFIVGRYRFSIVDRLGKLLFQHNFAKKPGGIPALPQISNGAEVIQLNGKIYLNSAPDIQSLQSESFEGKQCVKILELSTDKVTTELSFPETFHHGVFGPNYSSFYQAFNPDLKTFVFSFSNDNNVYQSELENINDLTSYWAGSKYFSFVKPMDKKYPENDDFDYYTKYYVQNPSYSQIIYDKYRHLFYRVALRPVDDTKYARGVRWKSKSLIVLDEKLRRLGEVDLPENTNPSEIVPISDGVLIHSGGRDENKLSFTLFNISKK